MKNAIFTVSIQQDINGHIFFMLQFVQSLGEFELYYTPTVFISDNNHCLFL